MVSDPSFDKRATETLNYLRGDVSDPSLPSVLCMTREGFDHDVDELRRRAKHYNWLRLPVSVWGPLQQAVGVPHKLNQQFGKFDYRLPRYLAAWKISEALAFTVLDRLHRELRLAAVMSANFDYGPDEGIRRACVHLPVAFLTLNREIPLFKFQSNYNNEHYRSYIGRPVVDGVAVGGALARDELLEWGIVDPDRIRITGFPRLDSRVDFLRNPQPGIGDEIVLFAYQDADYLSGDNFNEMLADFVRAAERHPSLRFVIKCKHDNDARRVVDALGAPSRHVEFSVLAASAHLPRARGVIGFNSLTVMESLISNAEVLVPQWGGARTGEEYQVLWRENPAHSDHVTFLDSREHFHETMDRIARGELRRSPLAGRLALLREFIHFDPSRTATEMLETFVTDYVARHRQSLVQAQGRRV